MGGENGGRGREGKIGGREASWPGLEEERETMEWRGVEGVIVCIYIQDADDQFLEDARDKILTGYVVLIQKRVRGWFLRRRFLALRKSAIILQKHYRRRLATRNWRKVRKYLSNEIKIPTSLSALFTSP